MNEILLIKRRSRHLDKKILVLLMTHDLCLINMNILKYRFTFSPKDIKVIAITEFDDWEQCNIDYYYDIIDC